VFTGAAHDQVVRLWDVRARKMVYELATGNNAVTGMTWDAACSALYVATACDYMDRNGETFDYRCARVPREPNDDPMTGGSDSEDEDADEYEEEDEEICWPKDAAYAEDYFGHMFDAGEHRLRRCCNHPAPRVLIFSVRYAFKEQADPAVLPEYGQATLDMGPSW
jgi:hypothetical protein